MNKVWKICIKISQQWQFRLWLWNPVTKSKYDELQSTSVFLILYFLSKIRMYSALKSFHPSYFYPVNSLSMQFTNCIAIVWCYKSPGKVSLDVRLNWHKDCVPKHVDDLFCRALGKTWNIKRDGSKIPRVPAIPRQQNTSKKLSPGKTKVWEENFKRFQNGSHIISF